MKLIIVESPTKAKTFSRFIDQEQFKIISSMGHLRDLPKKKLGIDIDHHFQPDYEIMAGKDKLLKEIVGLAKKVTEVILATDPDREGEAIAYHLKTVLQEKVKKLKFSRIVFHEITKEALGESLTHVKDIDLDLFNAQQARRILDRLFGYKLSPYLWKRFAKRWLSAGRVQSVALRFIVEREYERRKFKQEKTYLLKGFFLNQKELLPAKLNQLKGKPYYQSKKITLFDGQYNYQTTLITKETDLTIQKQRLNKETYRVAKIEENDTTRQPPPPYTTSTLQQAGSSYLGYSAKRTMRLAQFLYEQGLITYHRTDSSFLSEKFIASARDYIEKTFGKEYLVTAIRRYKTKTILAQEAHEAIRPTNLFYHPQEPTIERLERSQQKLYEMIYNRALSTQMSAAKLKNQKIEILSGANDHFVINNQTVIFSGFLILSQGEPEPSSLISSLKVNQTLVLKKLESEPKETQPPPYYNEASLIKTLESKGIGRPSTYAPIVSLIQERQYVEKRGRDLVPTELGLKTTGLLTQKFKSVMQPDFTAKMEGQLDAVATGSTSWQTTVDSYYSPFSLQLESAYTDTAKIKIEERTDKKCPKCGGNLVIKLSRFGKFYACNNFPKCKHTESFLTTLDVTCPKCNLGKVVMRFSKKKRRFYACSRYPDCDFTSLWLPKEKSQDKADGEQ